MQKVDAPTRKRRVGFNEAPERESNDVPSAPRRRLRRKTPTIPPRSEAVRQEIEAIGPLAPPPTPPPPVQERSGQGIPTRPGFRRKWKSDKRWGGAGGYWQWEPISKGKGRQHPPTGIEEQRASSSNEGALPSPTGPPVALRPEDGPESEDGPASNFPPQPESAQVPSPDPFGPGEPERQEDEGAAHEGVLPNPENEQPREDGQDRDEAASLFGEWDHRDGQDEEQAEQLQESDPLRDPLQEEPMAVDSSLRSPLRDLDEEISEAARLPPDIEEEEPLLPGEEASPASAEVRREVKRAHVNLGHCSKAILLRCMRASKCSPEHLAYAKRFRCALCAQRAAPGQVRPAAPPGVPKQFGEAVIIDLRFEKDSA